MNPVSITKPVTNAFTTMFVSTTSFNMTLAVGHICNVTGGAVTTRLCLVPPSGSPAQANALLWDFSIPANDMIEFGQGIIVLAGSSLQALGSVNNALTLHLSGNQG